jgi:hypothetical protein
MSMLIKRSLDTGGGVERLITMGIEHTPAYNAENGELGAKS